MHICFLQIKTMFCSVLYYILSLWIWCFRCYILCYWNCTTMFIYVPIQSQPLCSCVLWIFASMLTINCLNMSTSSSRPSLSLLNCSSCSLTWNNSLLFKSTSQSWIKIVHRRTCVDRNSDILHVPSSAEDLIPPWEDWVHVEGETFDTSSQH